MPGPPSHDRLPRWVDSRKFAQKGVELEGDIQAESMPRLRDAVAAIESPVHAHLRFGVGEGGKRTVRGPLAVTVSAQCQRCMEPTELQLKGELAVAVVVSDEEAKQLPRSLEPWLVDAAAEEVDLYAVVEDELLLDLPMVVYHPHPCLDQSLYSSGDAAEDLVENDQGRDNPFHVLKQLKKDRDGEE